jgi:hypothetical protein
MVRAAPYGAAAKAFVDSSNAEKQKASMRWLLST